MSNIKSFSLFLFIIFTLEIFSISGQILKKEEVLKYKPPKCKDDKQCPNNVQCTVDGYCDTKFFCQNEFCLEQREGMSFEYHHDVNTYKSSNTTDLILESCPEEARSIEKCFTRYCEINDNCYSNKCINNTCIASKDVTTNVCMFNIDKMSCYKPLQESCTKDEECYSGACNEYNFCDDISKKVYTKEEVLKYKPSKCKNDKECPTNVKCMNGHCNTLFFCQNDECKEQREGMSYEYNLDINTYKSSNTTDLILESCPEEARNQEKCFTRYCETDDNCYSNKCINNTCIANKDITTTMCLFYRDNMTCTKPPQESCTTDEECAPGFCNEYNFCVEVRDPWQAYSIFNLILLFSVFVIFITIIVLLVKSKFKS